MASKPAVAGEFILGLADMLFGMGKKDAAETLVRSASKIEAPGPGLIGTRTPVETPLPRQAPVPEFGPPRSEMSQAEMVRQGVSSRQAPMPAFGMPRGGMSQAQMVREGIPTVNSQVADSLQATAPELAAVIRANEVAGPPSSAYNFQPGLDLRNPAGSVSLVETISRRGKVTPEGTKIGGRMYDPRSFATPRNAETTRIAGTDRMVDRPDAPSRMPEGQMEMDMRSTREMVESAGGGRTAPSIPAAAMPQRVGGTGVMQDLGALVRNLPPQARVGLAGAGLMGAGLMIPGVDRELAEEADPANQVAVSPSVAPLASTDMGAQDLRQGRSPDPVVSAMDVQVQLTPDQNAALREQQSSVTERVQQSDPVASAALQAIAPRDPSYYTPERGGIEQYYQDRKNFVAAMDSGELAEMAQQVQEISAARDEEAQLEEWAMANPTLAYELINRAQMANPGQNEQSGQQVTSQALGSSLGTNNAANAQGQAEAAGAQYDVSVMGGSPLQMAAELQKNNELISAAAPIQYPRLQRAQDFANEALRRLQMGIG